MRLPGRLVLLGHPVGALALAALSERGARGGGNPGPLRGHRCRRPRLRSRVVESLRAEDTWGNVTVPHKERMHDACDDCTPLAERVRAVNTFWLDGAGRLVGDNTDVGGFSAAVETLLGRPPRDLTVGVLGAGGTAAAVLAAVELWPGCYAHVYNRTPERARLLCERFGSVAQPIDDVGVAAGADLVVNATSVGLRDDEFPMDPVAGRADERRDRSRLSTGRNGVGARASRDGHPRVRRHRHARGARRARIRAMVRRRARPAGDVGGGSRGH